MSSAIENGAKKSVNGKLCVYYDGYWIRYYAPPREGLTSKQVFAKCEERRNKGKFDLDLKEAIKIIE